MSDVETGEHTYGVPSWRAKSDGNGRRWYDPARMVMVLFGILGIFIAAWGGFVFNLAYGAGQKNTQQDAQIEGIGNWMKSVEGKLDRQDIKMDRILERIPK